MSDVKELARKIEGGTVHREIMEQVERGGKLTLSELCKTCKFDWDGHCINGNDVWKSKVGKMKIKCEDYKSREVDC